MMRCVIPRFISAAAIVKLRACCVTHSPFGFAVTPATNTRRVSMWMKNRINRSTMPYAVNDFTLAKSLAYSVAR